MGFAFAPPIPRVMKDRRVCRMGEVKRNPSGVKWDSGDDGLPRAPSNLLDFGGFTSLHSSDTILMGFALLRPSYM